MKIRYIAGINTDRFIVTYNDGFVKEYAIGYNASWTKRDAAFAHDNVVKAEKYHWTTSYKEKPFIGDVLPKGWERIDWTGYNVFEDLDFSQLYLEALKARIMRESMIEGEVNE